MLSNSKGDGVAMIKTGAYTQDQKEEDIINKMDRYFMELIMFDMRESDRKTFKEDLTTLSLFLEYGTTSILKNINGLSNEYAFLMDMIRKYVLKIQGEESFVKYRKESIDRYKRAMQ